MSGTSIELNGATVDEDIKSVDFISQQAVGTHVGTVLANFALVVNGSSVLFYAGSDIIATPDLYAAIAASSAATAAVTWIN